MVSGDHSPAGFDDDWSVKSKSPLTIRYVYLASCEFTV